MNLLIVDDEVVTTEVLKEKLDREYLGIEEIYTAYNVATAEKILRQKEIEVILCDVEMPQANGLELLNWVRDNQREVEFLFLTSHEKFEYVYGAMQKRAANYLLKPIDIPKINQALYVVIENIRRQKQLKEVKEYWDYGKRKILRDFWRNLLLGELTEDAEIHGELVKLGIEDMIREQYTLVFFQFQKEKIFRPGESRQLDQFIVDNILAEALTDEFEMANIIHQGERQQYNVIAVSDKPKKDIKSQVQAVRSMLEQYYDKAVCAVYISEECNLCRLGAVRREIQDYAREHVYENGEIIFFSELGKQTEKFQKRLDEKFVLQCLEKGERVKLLEYLQKSIVGIQRTDKSRVQMEYFQMDLIQIVGVFLHTHRMNLEAFFLDESYKKIRERSLTSTLCLIQWSVYYVNKVFDEIRDREKGKGVTDTMVDYIHNHYEENINRNILAEIVHLSPEYVGKIFKKEMGVGINEYLNQFRIQKAQNLLASTNYKVIDIALMVGYDNMPYFSSIFKKIVGMSPAEYKRTMEKRDTWG